MSIISQKSIARAQLEAKNNPSLQFLVPQIFSKFGNYQFPFAYLLHLFFFTRAGGAVPTARPKKKKDKRAKHCNNLLRILFSVMYKETSFCEHNFGIWEHDLGSLLAPGKFVA